MKKLALITIVTLIFVNIFPVLPAYAQTPTPTPPPVSMPIPDVEYLFDTGSPTNTGSGGGACTLTGNASISFDPERGNTLVLDGAGDYCRQDDVANLIAGGPFTLSAWVKETDSGERTVISIGGSTNANTLRLRNIGNSSTSWVVSYSTSVGTGKSLNTPDLGGVWHHEAIVFDGTQITIYYDGMALYSLYLGAWSTLNNNVFVGSRADGYALQGWIDDVRIYNEALAVGQIQYLALGYAVETHTSANLIQRFEADEQNQHYLMDTSGNNNTGYVQLGPVASQYLQFETINGDVWANTGNNDLRILADLAETDLITATSFTASGWFIDDGSNIDATYPALLTVSGGDYVTRLIYRFNSSSGQHELGIEHSAWNGEFVTQTATLGDAVFIAYQWDSATMTERLYISSTEVYSASYSGSLSAINKITWLGSGPYSFRHWRGKFNDLRIYNALVDVGDIINPPEPPTPGGCGIDPANYTLVGDYTVPADDADGRIIMSGLPWNGLDIGFYFIEAYGGPWYNNGTIISLPRYDGALAVDIGVWQPLSTFSHNNVQSLCSAFDGNYWRHLYAVDVGTEISARVNDFAIFMDNRGDLSFRVWRLNDNAPPPVALNVLSDSGMEQYPVSQHWFKSGYMGTFGRFRGVDFPNVQAVCGSGYHLIGEDPQYPLLKQYDAIEQNFYWPGGSGTLHAYMQTIMPQGPSPNPRVSIGIESLSGGSGWSTGFQATAILNAWHDVTQSFTLPAGRYLIRIYGYNTLIPDPNPQTLNFSVFVDQLVLVTGPDPGGWTCGDNPIQPTPTPTPNVSLTPTKTPTYTPTPDGAYNGVRNCSFEQGALAWSWHDGSRIETMGGPHGTSYAVADSVGRYDFMQEIYVIGGDTVISAWVAGWVEIRLVNRDTNTSYIFFWADRPYNDWEFVYASQRVPAGNYRLELNNDDPEHGPAFFDAVMVGAGLEPGGGCNGASLTPTPGTPPARTPTPTPNRATPTPTPTSSCNEPTDLLSIGKWTKWGFCKVVEYSAPQPWHKATIVALPTTYLSNKEPAGIMYEMYEVLRGGMAEIESRSWEPMPEMQGFPDVSAFERGLDMINIGQINIPTNPPPPTFACPGLDTPFIGPYLMQGVCAFFGVLADNNLLPWYQLGVNAAAILFLLRYLWKRWNRAA